MRVEGDIVLSLLLVGLFARVTRWHTANGLAHIAIAILRALARVPIQATFGLLATRVGLELLGVAATMTGVATSAVAILRFGLR